jgi:hypothetical protein
MKKSIVLFGLTLMMGLFLASDIKAQSPTWTDNSPWFTAAERLEAPWLRATDRVVSPVVRPGTAVRFDLGHAANVGAGLEMYRNNDASRPGEFRFVYGGGNFGDVRFIHSNGAGTFNTTMILDKDGGLKLDGKFTSTEIEVKLDVWSDFVFYDDYYLRPLTEVEQFIQTNRHLPDVPSEAEVLANGVNVGEMSATLLQKIEELTLYIIDLNKRIAELEK